MQEPFYSVPLVWIIQQDTLANRLPFYESMSWEHLISHWRDAFRRANFIVFLDYILPMLYSGLDTGNYSRRQGKHMVLAKMISSFWFWTGNTSQLKQGSWEWGYFQKDVEDSKGIEDLQKNLFNRSIPRNYSP
ncbi:hypothetical protein P3L10_005603 [Capsicum annuum]